MSRFKADIKALESQLRRQQRLLQELQQENEQYKHKESALLSTLITMQCRMSALASEGGNQSSREHSLHSVHSGSLSGATGVSEGSRDTSGLCRPDQALCAAPDSSPGHSSGQHYTAAAASPEAAQHLHQHTHQHIHQHAAAVGSCSAQSDSVCPPSLPSAAAAAAAEGGMSAQQAQLESQRSTAERSALDLARMQQQLQALDQLLQVDMQEVCSLAPSPAPGQDLAAGNINNNSSSSSTAGQDPLSTARLRALAADPGRVAAYLRLDNQQRSEWLAGTVRQLGLLLPKYGAIASATQQLKDLTEEFLARGLTYCWLDPDNCVMVDLALLNMETGQLEAAYPEGYWQYIAGSVGFTPQQKWALQALFRRVQAAQAPLVQQHEGLLTQLDNLQLHNHAQQQRFVQQMHDLPFKQMAQSLSRCRAEPPSGDLPPPQQQEQQQLRPPPSQQAQQQSSRVVFDPPLASDPSADLLLSHPCADQRRLEAQLSCVRGSLAWHEKMLCAQLLNMLAPDQVAAWLLASWPFAPNAMTLCQVLNDQGW